MDSENSENVPLFRRINWNDDEAKLFLEFCKECCDTFSDDIVSRKEFERMKEKFESFKQHSRDW